MDGVTLERVEPHVLEIKRYRVIKAGEVSGYVVQWESQIDTKIKGTRLVRRGKRRPFWTYATVDGMPHFRVKLETRERAVRWLVG